MGCDKSLKLRSLHAHLDIFFPETWDPSAMDMAKGSIRILRILQRGTVENGVHICGLTTAGK